MSSSSRTIEHVGEWRLELSGDTLEEVFREVAQVVAGAAGNATGPVGPWEDLDIEARDRVALLVDYANELVGRSEARGRAYDELSDLEVADAPLPRLHARLRGRQVTTWLSPLKAATYHGAELARDGKKWRANILFDV